MLFCYVCDSSDNIFTICCAWDSTFTVQIELFFLVWDLYLITSGVAYSKHIIHLYAYHGGDNLQDKLEVCPCSETCTATSIFVVYLIFTLIFLYTIQIEAHVGSVNDIAFCFPNKQLCIVTCGEDRLIKVCFCHPVTIFTHGYCGVLSYMLKFSTGVGCQHRGQTICLRGPRSSGILCLPTLQGKHSGRNNALFQIVYKNIGLLLLTCRSSSSLICIVKVSRC